MAVAATEKCGPTQRETGEAVLIVWPLVILLAALPQGALLATWKKLRPEIELPWARLGLLIGAAAIMAGFMVVNAEKPWRWATEALWLFGCSYGAVLLLATRLWLQGDRRHALVGPHLVASVVFVPYAMTLRGGLFDGARFDTEMVFIVPGYGGWVTGGIALLLGIELFVRWRKRRAATSPPA